jgi:hypothetical protein
LSRCWNHGEYDGYECPTCAQIKATEAVAEATRNAADREERSAALQIAQAQRLEHAQYGTQDAIHRAAEQNQILVRDGWKLQVDSKVQRALELLNNDMFAESSSILRDALATDPGNLFVHIYLAVAELRSGKFDEYWLHLQKGIQLLGTTDYSTVVPYRETTKLFFVPSPDEENAGYRKLREVFFQKLGAYLQNRPRDVDVQLLEAIAQKGWDDIARLGVAAIDPERLSLSFVQISLKHGCTETAAFAAQKLVELAAARKDTSAWLEGALTMGQIRHRINRDALHNCVRLLAGWPIEQVYNLLDQFVTDHYTMKRSFSNDAWISLSVAFRSYYREIRTTIYEYIDRRARAQSQSAQTGAAVWGLGVSAVAFVVLLAISTIFNATQSFLLFIAVAAIGAGIVVSEIRKASAIRQAFTECQAELRALQQRIEQGMGFGEPLPEPSIPTRSMTR